MNQKTVQILKSHSYIQEIHNKALILTYQAFITTKKKEKAKLIEERDHYLNLYNEYMLFFDQRHRFMNQR